MISENYEISGLKSESSQEKENIFRSAVFRQKNTFFSSLFLKKAQSKTDCLYLTTNQEMSVGPWLRPTCLLCLSTAVDTMTKTSCYC